MITAPKPSEDQFSFSATLYEKAKLDLIDIAKGLCKDPQITSVEVHGREITVNGHCAPVVASFGEARQ